MRRPEEIAGSPDQGRIAEESTVAGATERGVGGKVLGGGEGGGG